MYCTEYLHVIVLVYSKRDKGEKPHPPSATPSHQSTHLPNTRRQRYMYCIAYVYTKAKVQKFLQNCVFTPPFIFYNWTD